MEGQQNKKVSKISKHHNHTVNQTSGSSSLHQVLVSIIQNSGAQGKHTSQSIQFNISFIHWPALEFFLLFLFLKIFSQVIRSHPWSFLLELLGLVSNSKVSLTFIFGFCGYFLYYFMKYSQNEHLYAFLPKCLPLSLPLKFLSRVSYHLASQ